MTLYLAAVAEATVTNLFDPLRDIYVAPPTSGAEIFAGIWSRGVRVALPFGRPQRPHHHVPDAVVRRFVQEQEMSLVGLTTRPLLAGTHRNLRGNPVINTASRPVSSVSCYGSSTGARELAGVREIDPQNFLR